MLSPYARTQAIIDSLTAVNNSLASKLNSADTAAMLASYVTVAGSTVLLNSKVNTSDTASMLSPYLIRSLASSTYLPLSGGTLTGSLNGTTATFTSDASVNGVKIGKGIGQGDQNTAIGQDALGTGTGSRNTAIGNFAMKSYSGASSDNNTSVGYSNMVSLTSGKNNTSVGSEAMMALSTGSKNTAIGLHALISTTGGDNTALGSSSGTTVSTGSQNTFIGSASNILNGAFNNATAIGFNAVVDASNKIQLGNLNVTAVNTSANVTAKSFIKSGGTSSQYLMADGSVSSGPATINDATDEFTATVAQTNFTLTQTPSANSKVKMYINGIRISNSAYSWSGTTLTYDATKNGSYSLTANDRIQFDYFY